MRLEELFYSKDKYQGKERELFNEDDNVNFKVIVDGEEYQYHGYAQEEEDRTTWFHNVTHRGKKTSMDWSSFKAASPQEVELWIKVGMPNRYDVGTTGFLSKDHLVKLARKHGIQI